MPRYGRNPKAGLTERVCQVCGQSYQPYRDNQRACSRPCRERLPDRADAAKVYRARPDIRDRKNAARRVDVNPSARDSNLRSSLRRYGITLDEYERMVETQGGRCAICGERPDPAGVKAASRLHLDHDHVTGRNRGLLCVRCNPGVGYFRDDPALLRAAADYIDRHRRP